MLKMFHTADWHLGQSLRGYDRDEEHRCFLSWLLKQLQEERPDALLIAGDIFDSINPSAAAQKRWYHFLADAHASVPDLQIVVTAGNHDAGARLEAPADVLRSLHISIVGTVPRDREGQIDTDRLIVPIRSRDGTTAALVMAVPFLRPSDVPAVAAGHDAWLDGIRELYGQTYQAAATRRAAECPDAAIIAMGHCHIRSGRSTADSERHLVIGGAEALPADVFDDGIAYVALGHLHLAQSFEGGRVRYSGSPIPLSFSEIDYRHQILSVQVDGNRLTSVESRLIPRTTQLLRVPPRGSAVLPEVLRLLNDLPENGETDPNRFPYLEVRVQEDGPDPARRSKIEQALEGRPFRLASIRVERSGTASSDVSPEPPDASALQNIDPEELFLEAWKEKYDTVPDRSVLDALREILREDSPEA